MWVRHIQDFPFRRVHHLPSSVTVAFRATKIPTTLRVDVPVAIRATKNLEGIKDKYQNFFNFKFELVRTDQVIKFIDEIDCNKTSSGDIPAKIIKMQKKKLQNQ